MKKTVLIDEYIKKGNDILVNSEKSKAEEYISTTLHTCESDIKSFSNGMTLYGYGDYNYIYDIKLIISKLNKLRYDLLDGQDKLEKEIELEKYKAKTSMLKQNIYNNNQSSAISSSNINLTIDQVINNINSLPESVINQEDKEKLEELIASVEGFKNSSNKDKLWSKVKKVLVFLADKSIDISIAVFPYLMTIPEVVERFKPIIETLLK